MYEKQSKLYHKNRIEEKRIRETKTTHNRSVYATPPVRAARATKNRSRAMPFVRFFSATFGAGVVASQRPFTCPKRRKQPERYAKEKPEIYIIFLCPASMQG
jgi:hypothetical protein